MAEGSGRYKFPLGYQTDGEPRQRERPRPKERSESHSDEGDSRARQRGRGKERERRRGSQSSVADTQSRQRSRSRMPDKDYEVTEQMFNEDFKLMLALSPTPDEAFCPKSVDHVRAVQWRNKLMGWQCESLKELRMRQTYMSYFSVCLNQKQLRGIFGQEPQPKLCWMDFQDIVVPNAGCMSSTGEESAWLSMINMLQHQGSCCSQSAKAAESTSGSRHAGGFNRRKYPPGTTHKLAYGSRPKLVPKSNLSLSQSSSYDCTASSSSLVAAATQRQRRPIDQQTRKDMDYLLAIITAELRGEQLSEPDDYFELELKRYREFCARHRYNNPDYQFLEATNASNERIHMLLNMQNDLIKLLSK